MVRFEGHYAARGPKDRLDTLAVHAGEARASPNAPLVAPIHQSAVYTLDAPEAYDSYRDIPYVRHGNTPTQSALAQKLAALEGTETALLTPSGMAAIHTVLTAQLRRGDTLCALDQLYGGTQRVIHDLATRLGLELVWLPYDAPERWDALTPPEVRLVYGESLMNPLLRVPSLPALAQLARSRGALSVVDSTVATPVGIRPHALGVDIVVHSATKYLNGHSDLSAGVISGRATQLAPLQRQMLESGVCLDPHSCFLLQRGLKTLPLRFRQQSATAQALATWLSTQPAVRRVHYPFAAQTRGLLRTLPALVSFELETSVDACVAFMHRLRLARVAPSFGGVETTLCRPANTSHGSVSATERARLGIADTLVRFSVGLEDFDDLRDDLAQGLSSLRPRGTARQSVQDELTSSVSAE